VIQALYSPLDKTGYRAVKIFVLLSLFFLFSSIYAQKAVVHGTVTDANSNEKLIGVSVMMDSLTGVPTNNEGHYRLDLNPGQYRLQFRYIGYQSEQRIVDLNHGRFNCFKC
jgi:hypothetical protein